ncbi:MAG: hypothetical protein IPM76_22755 [Chloroflexi bacterium]|nr:hypothetical protein [Chloroflexota bacterium]
MEMQLNRDRLDKDVQQALRAWHNSGDDSADSLSYLLLVQAQMAAAPPPRSGGTVGGESGAAQRPGRNDYAEQEQSFVFLNSAFSASTPCSCVANRLNVGEHAVSQMRQAAIDQLADAIYRQELALRDSKIQEITALLPPATYSQLFGAAEIQTDLIARLRDPGSPWVIAVTGLGGIGKTALADSVIRRLVPELHLTMWSGCAARRPPGQSIRFPHRQPSTDPDHRTGPTFLGAKRRRKHAKPAAGPGAAAIKRTAVSHHHRQPGNRNRHRISSDPAQQPGQSQQIPAHQPHSPRAAGHRLHLRHPRTVADDSVTLLNHHAQELGVMAKVTAVAADYQAIWNVTGGHPLALKLVAVC